MKEPTTINDDLGDAILNVCQQEMQNGRLLVDAENIDEFVSALANCFTYFSPQDCKKSASSDKKGVVDWRKEKEKFLYDAKSNENVRYSEVFKWLEQQSLPLPSTAENKVSKDMWKMLEQINIIMWESYMIEGREFGRTEGYKIMGILEQWAERH